VRSEEYPSDSLSRGLKLFEYLKGEASFSELESTVSDLDAASLREAVTASIASFQQQRKSPDDYAAWWRDPDPEGNQ
jgi:hypothetical protein